MGEASRCADFGGVPYVIKAVAYGRKRCPLPLNGIGLTLNEMLPCNTDWLHGEVSFFPFFPFSFCKLF
jgi:hypothetical protein